MVGPAVGTKAALYAKIAATVGESAQQFPEVGKSFQVRMKYVNVTTGVGFALLAMSSCVAPARQATYLPKGSLTLSKLLLLLPTANTHRTSLDSSRPTPPLFPLDSSSVAH